MAEIEKNKVLKVNVEVLGILDYIKKYQPGLTPQSVSYAMNKEKIDFVRIGFERLVVMTEHTRSYVPNDNKNRAVVKKKSKSVKTVLST